MSQITILTAHTSLETAYEVKDYRYAKKLRTSKYYWVESQLGCGDKICTYTINPTTGKPNRIKATPYTLFAYLFLNASGKIQIANRNFFELDNVEKSYLFMIDQFGVANMNEIQIQNIRARYLELITVNAMYVRAHTDEALRKEITRWLSTTKVHIENCSFDQLLDHFPLPMPMGYEKVTMKRYR